MIQISEVVSGKLVDFKLSLDDLPQTVQLFKDVCVSENVRKHYPEGFLGEMYHFFVVNTSLFKYRQDLILQIQETINKTDLLKQNFLKIYSSDQEFIIEKFFWSCRSEFFSALFSKGMHLDKLLKFPEVENLNPVFALLEKILKNPTILKVEYKNIALATLLEAYKLADRLMLFEAKVKIENEYLTPLVHTYLENINFSVMQQQDFQKILTYYKYFTGHFLDHVWSLFYQKGLRIDEERSTVSFANVKVALENDVWLLLGYPFLYEALDVSSLESLRNPEKETNIVEFWRDHLGADFYYRTPFFVHFTKRLSVLKRFKTLKISFCNQTYSALAYKALTTCDKIEHLIFESLPQIHLDSIYRFSSVKSLHLMEIQHLKKKDSWVTKMSTAWLRYVNKSLEKTIEAQLVSYIRSNYPSLEELSWPSNVSFNFENPPLIPSIRFLNLYQETFPSKNQLKRLFDKFPFLDEIRLVSRKKDLRIEVPFYMTDRFIPHFQFFLSYALYQVFSTRPCLVSDP